MKKTDKINKLKDLRLQVSALNAEIKDLEAEICHLTDNDDSEFIIRNWQKLMRMQEKFQPETFKKIVVSCFPIKTTICCGLGGSRWSIKLAQLLTVWANGFMFEGKPIVDLCFCNSSEPKITYIDDSELVQATISYEQAEKFDSVISAIPPCEKYSDSSVTELKIGGE